MQVRFGSYLLDLESRGLLQRGRRSCTCRRRPSILLSILVTHRPKALSKNRSAGSFLAGHVRSREKSGEPDW